MVEGCNVMSGRVACFAQSIRSQPQAVFISMSDHGACDLSGCKPRSSFNKINCIAKKDNEPSK